MWFVLQGKAWGVLSGLWQYSPHAGASEGLGSWPGELCFSPAMPASGDWGILTALVTHPPPANVHLEYESSILEWLSSRP